MRSSSLVGHVIEVLDIVLAGRRPADVVVKEFFRARHYLGSSDRRFIAERTFDILRHHMLLTQYCTEGMASLHAALPDAGWPSVALVATHDIRCTGAADRVRVPAADLSSPWLAALPDVDCAAFLAAVEQAEIPATIRNDDEQFLSVRHSIPRFIVHDWMRRFGGAEAEALCASISAAPPISVRVNALKCTVDECRAALNRAGVDSRPGSISPSALTLAKRINAQGLLPFKQGWFEMQDEGSQIVSLLVGAREGMTILDACAGGGGKGLHLSALMHNRGRLIAADLDDRKLENFLERGRRAGVTIGEAVKVGERAGQGGLDGVAADAVLVDAPCSGTGTFRRNPWMKMNLTEADVTSCAHLQRDLLECYSMYVRPGGRLVYSTCSLLEQENQNVVKAFLHNHPGFRLLSAPAVLEAQGVTVAGETEFLELMPHRTTTDGFFGAVMERSLPA